MDIKVNVTIGTTPALESFLSRLLVAVGSPKPVELHELLDCAGKDKEPEKVEPKSEPQKVTAEMLKEQPKEAPKAYTTEDVREAMNRCRCRFEGDDYKDNTESDGYKKHHKALTAWFKYVAQTSGSERPSDLPAEKRKCFIEDCDNTILGDDGNFTISVPSNPGE